MKLDRLVIAAVAAILTLGSASMTAQAEPRAKKANVAAIAANNPAADKQAAWNQGDEPFCEFLEMWIASPRFRADRSQNAKMAACNNGQISFSDSQAWSSREIFNMAFGGKNKKEMKKNFTPCKAKMNNQGQVVNEAEWIVTDENTMVYETVTNGNSQYGPTEMQMIFQRINGQWQLTGVMMEG